MVYALWSCKIWWVSERLAQVSCLFASIMAHLPPGEIPPQTILSARPMGRDTLQLSGAAMWWGSRRSVVVQVLVRLRGWHCFEPCRPGETSRPMDLQAGSISFFAWCRQQWQLHLRCETGRHSWKTSEKTASTRTEDACLKADRHKSLSRGKT